MATSTDAGGQRHRLGAGDHDSGVAGVVAAEVHRRQGQHLRGGIEGDDLGSWPASCRRAAEGAGAGTDVEDGGAGAVRGQPGRGDIEDADRRRTDDRRPVALVSAGVAVVAGDDGGHQAIVPCRMGRARRRPMAGVCGDRGRRVRRPTAGVRYGDDRAGYPRRHLRLLRHPDRLGGRRGCLPVSARVAQ